MGVYLFISAIRTRPVDAPTTTRHSYPEQSLCRSSAGVVIQRSGALVEPAGVPGIWERELMKINMMAELVTEST